eukprot:3999539-Amphidinium_carterae.1
MPLGHLRPLDWRSTKSAPLQQLSQDPCKAKAKVFESYGSPTSQTQVPTIDQTLKPETSHPREPDQLTPETSHPSPTQARHKPPNNRSDQTATDQDLRPPHTDSRVPVTPSEKGRPEAQTQISFYPALSACFGLIPQ